MMNKQELLKALEIQKGVLKETQTHLDNIEQEIKKLDDDGFEPTPKGWKPDDGEKYHFPSSCCAWTSAPYDSKDAIHNSIVRYNRVFKTKEECKLYCRIQKAFMDASREFVEGESNYYAYCDTNKKINMGLHQFNNHGLLYFDSRKTIQSLIDKFGEENVKRYYLGVY